MQMSIFTADWFTICLEFRSSFIRRSLPQRESLDGVHNRLEELINVDKIIRPAYMPLAEYREYKNLNDR